MDTESCWNFEPTPKKSARRRSRTRLRNSRKPKWSFATIFCRELLKFTIVIYEKGTIFHCITLDCSSNWNDFTEPYDGVHVERTFWENPTKNYVFFFLCYILNTLFSLVFRFEISKRGKATLYFSVKNPSTHLYII